MSRTPVSKESLRRACARYATGVAIVTVTDSAGLPHGLTVNSFTSVSAEPPLVLVCIDHTCTLLPEFSRSECFAINILRDSQRDISERFAWYSGDRFEGVDWRNGVAGAPVLTGSLAVIECRRFQLFTSGDHEVLIGEVVAAEADSGKPLIYFGSGYRSIE